MCTIIGGVVNSNKLTNKDIKFIIDYIYTISPIRGRDGFGMEFFVDGERVDEMSYRTKSYESFCTTFESYFLDLLDGYDGYIKFLVQSRAAPETEKYDIELKYIQPVVSSDKTVILAHNGLIFNDKELIKQFNLEDLNIKYDSQVIPELIAKLKDINKVYSLLKGSFSIIMHIENDINKIRYMVNYQPLYYQQKDDRYILLSNVKQPIRCNDCILEDYRFMEVEPYSCGEFELTC